MTTSEWYGYRIKTLSREAQAKRLALDFLNANRLELNRKHDADLKPLKIVPAFWWTMYGAKWLAKVSK